MTLIYCFKSLHLLAIFKCIIPFFWSSGLFWSLFWGGGGGSGFAAHIKIEWNAFENGFLPKQWELWGEIRKRPTCLWGFCRDLVGVSSDPMFTTGSQAESISSEGLQVLQQVCCGRLKTDSFLWGGGEKKCSQFSIKAGSFKE